MCVRGAAADTIRVGFLNAELQRDGPGLLLRDILRREDEDIAGVAEVVGRAQPDILVLSGFDYDHGAAALGAFRDLLAETGPRYPHLLAPPTNAGLDTGADLDGDGRMRGARDAQGYGGFAGQGGLAVLSRYPITGMEDFNELLWRTLPGSLASPEDPGWEEQRLSSVAHVAITLGTPDRPMTILAFHATPPVFDGPEDRNGRRNRDEAAFWLHYLDGAFGPAPDKAFVLLGDANLDPLDGDGRPDALRALLADPRLLVPELASAEAAAAAEAEGGANRSHRGNPALDTANWRDGPGDPGNLRVDYILPSSDWMVEGSGVTWGAGEHAPRHGLVWADLGGVPGARPPAGAARN